jgi:hypothetical protein
VSTSIPFRLRGLDGRIVVDLEANKDPRRWGYDLLGLPYAAEVAEGFPVVRASVSFAGEGYAAAMGWIQIVRYGTGEAEDTVLVDLPPQLSEARMPYCYWGVCPSFFDAPSFAQEGVTWVADAFLTVTPDALMTKIVQPVCGFRWGFKTSQNSSEFLPLEPTDVKAWYRARKILQDRYPDGEFLPE